MAACALIATLLAGCETSSEVAGKLPSVPSDIQLCFRRAATVIPDKALTVAEVEALWKIDRIRGAVMQRCGTRLLSWYDELRSKWR